MAARNTILINPDGKIAKVYTAVNPAGHSEEILKDLAALKKADASGSSPPTATACARQCAQVRRRPHGRETGQAATWRPSATLGAAQAEPAPTASPGLPPAIDGHLFTA